MHRTTRFRSPSPALAVVCAAALAGGCTMCPDPFDYSGPVPNGSSPQNDFRARSNGIRPLLAAPRPFPPVVQDDSGPTPADTPTTSVLAAAASEAEEGGVVPVVREALAEQATDGPAAAMPLAEPQLERVPQAEGESPAVPASTPSASTPPASTPSASTPPASTPRAATPRAAAAAVAMQSAIRSVMWSVIAPSDGGVGDLTPPPTAGRSENRPGEALPADATTTPAPLAETPAPAAPPPATPRPAATAGETPGWRPRR